MKRPDMEVLENLIEHSTLAAVLEMLERICHKKAEHLREHWHDEYLARCREKAARQIEDINIDV
ncbi:MAG: hypothetical protein HRU34_07110 [Richelia sp.]|nr:hypothetical protein [Richelia sp.]CDN15818.1 hypothetical protein RintRC_6746 [Richelia intracellularis]